MEPKLPSKVEALEPKELDEEQCVTLLVGPNPGLATIQPAPTDAESLLQGPLQDLIAEGKTKINLIMRVAKDAELRKNANQHQVPIKNLEFGDK